MVDDSETQCSFLVFILEARIVLNVAVDFGAGVDPSVDVPWLRREAQ